MWPLIRSKEDFRKKSEISVSRPPKNYPHTRARFSTQLINTEPRVRITISQIVVKMGHGPLPISFPNLSQTCCEPTKTFSLETWRVYLRVKIFFRSSGFVIQIQILPGWKIFFSSQEIEFLLARRKFSSCHKKKTIRKIFRSSKKTKTVL